MRLYKVIAMALLSRKDGSGSNLAQFSVPVLGLFIGFIQNTRKSVPGWRIVTKRPVFGCPYRGSKLKKTYN